MNRALLLTASLAVAFSGCKAKQVLKLDLLPPAVIKPKFVTLTVEDVVIKAPDGRWEIRKGKELAPPFESQLGPYLAHPKTKPANGARYVAKWEKEKTKPPTGAVTRWPSAKEAKRACNHSRHTRLFYEYLPTAPEEPTVTKKDLPDLYTQLLRRGAQRVMVEAKALKKPLYGVLFLPPVLRETGTGIERITRISLSNRDLARAASGRLAVVTEVYESSVKVKGVRYSKSAMKSLIDEEQFYKRIRVNQLRYALYLSKEPI